jgi:hypothetical protein
MYFNTTATVKRDVWAISVGASFYYSMIRTQHMSFAYAYDVVEHSQASVTPTPTSDEVLRMFERLTTAHY